MSDPPGAIPAKRGCGVRQKGGLYAECAISPSGKPIEEFLFDPPIIVPAGFAVPTRGVVLVERAGIWHVVDRVGNEFYPSPADMAEEIKRFGLSRRIPTTSTSPS